MGNAMDLTRCGLAGSRMLRVLAVAFEFQENYLNCVGQYPGRI